MQRRRLGRGAHGNQLDNVMAVSTAGDGTRFQRGMQAQDRALDVMRSIRAANVAKARERPHTHALLPPSSVSEVFFFLK